MINVLAYSLGTYESGLDASMADDLGGECAEECLTLISGFSELGKLFSVTHHYDGGSVGCSNHGASGEGAGASCFV